MKSASNTVPNQPATVTGSERPLTLPERPVGGVTAGLDWALHDHAVAVVDVNGREIDRATIEHTRAGLAELLTFLARHRVGEVAIERGDGPVVDTLLDAQLSVVVIAPDQVKNLRGRYGSAGNKDDRFDAFVLADTLRTDRARLVPLTPDSDATLTLRRTCRARKDLVGHRVALANQLRAHLLIVFPGVVGLFSDLDSPISLTFLHRFTTQHDADWLTVARLTAWLTKTGYPGRTHPDTLHARLTNATRGTTGDTAATDAATTQALAAALTVLNTQIKTLEHHIDTQLSNHADQHIFTSLPRPGRVRAARLLAEIGDVRSRYPTPNALACHAGVAPSTRQSGKLHTVGFRWSCDKQLRDALTDFANGSRHDNPWAADIYQRARDRQHDHAHAIRILARAWTYVIWRCWQDRTAYNPTQHNGLQQHLNQDQQAAA